MYGKLHGKKTSRMNVENKNKNNQTQWETEDKLGSAS